jgi:hypothetical protein
MRRKCRSRGGGFSVSGTKNVPRTVRRPLIGSVRPPLTHGGVHRARRRAVALAYSHSIVPGGFDVMSSTTRFTSRSSLIMREATFSSRS